MADVTVYVDSSGNADDPGIARGQTIMWELDSGVTGPFALSPPPNMFHRDDNPSCVTLDSQNPDSPTYTAKHSAAKGAHKYDIEPGTCDDHSRKGAATGPQKITVETA